jgi:hypothetical protein
VVDIYFNLAQIQILFYFLSKTNGLPSRLAVVPVLQWNSICSKIYIVCSIPYLSLGIKIKIKIKIMLIIIIILLIIYKFHSLNSDKKH